MRKWLPIALILAMAIVLYGGSQNTVKDTDTRGMLAQMKHGMPVSEMNTVDPDYQLPPVGSRNPQTLDEIVLSEGFEAVAEESLPVGWTHVDVDGGTTEQTGWVGLTVWRVRTITSHGGTKSCCNVYNSTGGANNDWLILPQQNLTGDITLRYWISSQLAPYLEEYEVRVSTTGTQPANFTNLIYSGVNIPVSFVQHTHDLSAFAGAPFYIAFRYISNDEFIIKLDDVVIERTEAVPRGAISGLVTDVTNGGLLQNVNVTVVGTQLTATTNASGVYYITNVPVNTYSLQFTKSGYLPMDVANVAVVANDTVTANAAMQPVVFVIQEGFEAVAANALPTGWTQVDVDNGTCPTSETQFPGEFSRWRVRDTVFPPNSGTKLCLNHYNDNMVQNNDWLILPQQNLTGQIILGYWMATQQALYPESYEVRVSTTGTLPANFTNLIYTGTDIPEGYTEHTHNLSAFAGAPFYIAFHHTSTDKWVIKLDDVTLANTPQAAGTISGTVTNSLTSAPLPGVTVSVMGTSITATTNAAGAYILLSVPVDTHDVRFVKADYDTLVAEDIIVTEGDITNLDVSLDPTDAAGDAVQLPKEFAFYGNYPNPFNARTEFHFAVDRAGMVELTLYNIVGQEVARVVHETMNAGVHTVAFDAGNLPSGLYLARLSAAGRTAVQKTMLLK